jgi:hypothetical protein
MEKTGEDFDDFLEEIDRIAKADPPSDKKKMAKRINIISKLFLMRFLLVRDNRLYSFFDRVFLYTLFIIIS